MKIYTKVEWYHNHVDLLIQPDEHRTFLVKDNQYSLVLEKCDLVDSGEYKAVFKKSFREGQSYCRLNVNPNNRHESKNLPIFLDLFKDINVNEGQDV